MIHIKIVAVGGLKEKHWSLAMDEYLKRISRFAKIKIVEVAEFVPSSSTSPDTTKKKEAELILKELEGCTVILDRSGKNLSSEELAKLFEDKSNNGISKFTFVIGGSYGLDKSIIKAADFVLSFGKMTFPHQLMRVILVEQIYRAMTINGNITYHK